MDMDRNIGLAEKRMCVHSVHTIFLQTGINGMHDMCKAHFVLTVNVCLGKCGLATAKGKRKCPIRVAL